jgi:hypothetical protein
MNMNPALVNRALLDVGHNPLTEQDIHDKNTNFDLCKRYYLETFLEALSEVSWTGGRKRAKLVRTGRPNLLPRDYRYAYDMPFDCSRPIELQGNEYFVVEDRLIYTNADKAELLYVSNGKIMRPVAVLKSTLGGVPDMEYITAGPPGTDHRVIFRAGRPADILLSLPEDPTFEELGEDFPDYRPLEYEAKFYEYVEKMLAAKFAMKLSNQPQLKVQMLQEALLIKQEATKTSLGQRAAQVNPARLWKEELGL